MKANIKLLNYSLIMFIGMNTAMAEGKKYFHSVIDEKSVTQLLDPLASEVAQTHKKCVCCGPMRKVPGDVKIDPIIFKKHHRKRVLQPMKQIRRMLKILL